MRIEQLMSKPAIICRGNDMLDVAAKLMWEHDCGCIPVTDEKDRLIGILTDRDICMATYLKAKPPHAISVTEILPERVYSCRADEPLEAAERLMSDHQVRRVPVVDEEHRPIGLISINDLTRYAAADNAGTVEVLQTIAATCQPRNPQPTPGTQRPTS